MTRGCSSRLKSPCKTLNLSTLSKQSNLKDKHVPMFLLICVNSCVHCNCRMKYQLRLVDEKDEILTSIEGGNIMSYTAMCFMNKISNFMKKVRWLKTPR